MSAAPETVVSEVAATDGVGALFETAIGQRAADGYRLRSWRMTTSRDGLDTIVAVFAAGETTYSALAKENDALRAEVRELRDRLDTAKEVNARLAEARDSLREEQDRLQCALAEKERELFDRGPDGAVG